MKINVERIYEPENTEDGYRILIDRLWPRGISKERADIDYWAKEICPSNELRTLYHKGIDDYAAFTTAYESELESNLQVHNFFEVIKDKETICLLTAVKNVTQSHVPIIKKMIDKHFN